MTDRNRQRTLPMIAALAVACVVLAGCSGGSHVSDGWALSTPVLQPDVRFDGGTGTTVALGVTAAE